MATYKADTLTQDGHVVPIVNEPTTVTVPFDWTVAATLDLNAADVVQLAVVPQGARVVGWSITAPAMDSGTTVTADVGFSTDTDAFMADAEFFRAGGTACAWSPAALTGMVVGAVPTAEFGAAAMFQLTVTASVDTATAGGTLIGFIQYVIRPIALR